MEERFANVHIYMHDSDDESIRKSTVKIFPFFSLKENLYDVVINEFQRHFMYPSTIMYDTDD